MSERLRPRDVAVLAEESASTPMHNATVEIFDPGDSGFDYARLVRLVEDRISFVPRYRQRIQTVPGRLANPVWVDDDRFEIGYHVRRSALPRPGSVDQLRDLASRIISRPLDRNRPLWELYLVEGLADGRVAMLSKSHHVLVDGVQTVDIGQVLLDANPELRELGHDEWHPRGRPSPFSLMAGAVRDSVTEVETVTDTVAATTGAVLRGVADGARTTGRVLDALTNRSPRAESPIIGPLSQQRRLVMVRTDLADHRKVREVHGGSVNDVVLATITGALRAWLMTRGESMRGIRQIRALAPVSVIDDELEPTSLGSQIAAHFVDLPVGEPSPVVRLHQVSYSFLAHQETGRGIPAARLAGMSGFAPATFHALGARVAGVERRRGYQLCVTNVPGPQTSLYAAGARMVASYPVPPLFEGHPLAIGVTSYDGSVFYGLNADRDLLPDAELLGPCLVEALDELVDSTSAARNRAPRGRRKRKAPEGP
ncbi:wax ester/triacylglycerol synthase family O-acyltransferase [Nocardioides sp. LMS-CY]|uniref:WS/DGAT/MGAT family O-acyltransferase n=1 Tax=Nocardioides sp. (strain LMS-CY) TaxID=2840457 RepID=UPI001C005635|nr:wax ester/triacylglycerol synthase family O-acyltransferase [Nocardioides sp. LMS-CY]QWF23514.1 wax ester/triacylglycerol synthase family O-acyltransferase [Nocardioides sp. LMS-CY]